MRRQLAILLGVVLVFQVPDLRAGDVITPHHGRRTAIVEAIQRAQPAVVNIHSERLTAAADGVSPSRANGMGTGIIIDPRGYIVTNHHVVEDVNLLRVRLADGSAYLAKVMARSKEHDLALIKIDAGRPLPIVRIGTSKDLMIGETVIAIGNAFGYENTVSVGIVSALGRDVTLNKEISYKSLIQTDASINPGNSGGPLLNIEGELIGVNVAIRAGAQGISFAIPVDQMVQVVGDMFARRRQELALGFGYRDVIDVSQPGLPRVRVADVQPHTAAAKAGLQPGDVIIQVGDYRVLNPLDLERALCERKPTERLPVRLKRGDQELEIELNLEDDGEPDELRQRVWQVLGMRLRPATSEQAAQARVPVGTPVVTAVRKGSPAERVGMQRGDVLVGLHQWEINSFDHIAYVLNHADFKSFRPLRFLVVRAGQKLWGNFELRD
jgi:serine protease Do